MEGIGRSDEGNRPEIFPSDMVNIVILKICQGIKEENGTE